MYERNEPAPSNVEQGKSGLSPTLIAFIVLGVIALVFVLQNGDDTQTNFLMLDFSAPLWLLLAITIAVGIVLDRLFALWWKRRRRDR